MAWRAVPVPHSAVACYSASAGVNYLPVLSVNSVAHNKRNLKPLPKALRLRALLWQQRLLADSD